MSRISQRRQDRPHGSAAWLMESTMCTLSDARSLKTVSSVSLPVRQPCHASSGTPSSERMVVCASWATANSGSSTPYEACVKRRERGHETGHGDRERGHGRGHGATRNEGRRIGME
jgi:hypothetical protein